MAQPEPVELAAHVGDVGLGVGAGVLAGLAGVLLGRQPERVEAHRVQHVEAAHPLEADVHVGGDVAQRMAHVQPRPRRVREHVHDEQLGTSRAAARRELLRRVRRLIDAAGVPMRLPAGLDLSRERRVVAMRGRVDIRHGHSHDVQGCASPGGGIRVRVATLGTGRCGQQFGQSLLGRVLGLAAGLLAAGSHQPARWSLLESV